MASRLSKFSLQDGALQVSKKIPNEPGTVLMSEGNATDLLNTIDRLIPGSQRTHKKDAGKAQSYQNC